ncbi:MAG: chromosomal replication initiator protein DnaA [Candidatus Brennerbacteria bacterium]|nr:chromosomal replication initiator protein DnaA [Candidatus Brennerbacteria bacterium]
MGLDEIWQIVLGEIELQVSKPNFLTWLKNSRLVEKKDGVALVSLPNNFAKEWVKNKYHKLILGSLRNLDASTKNIDYLVSGQQGAVVNLASGIINNQTRLVQEPLMESKIDLETNLNSRYTLKTFIVGSSNELAFAAASAVVKKVGSKYNPLYIYGGVGLGKTHLMQAVGNEIKKNYQEKIKPLYITSEKFINDVVWGIRNKRMEDIKNKYRNVDVLIIDDIQFIGGKEACETEFFHTFNALYEQNKQIIISSDKPPRSIPTLEERLRSRFEGGMIADITYPNYEMRVAILRNKLQENNWELGEELVNYIANKVQRNIRELEGVLNRIIFYKDTKNEKITAKKIEEVINETTQNSPKNINPNDIIKSVADFFEVPINELIGRVRKKEIVEPRQIAMYLLREILNLSYPFIGEKLGKKDHTTAIHACSKISREITQNSFLNQRIMLIKEQIYKS